MFSPATPVVNGVLSGFTLLGISGSVYRRMMDVLFIIVTAAVAFLALGLPLSSWIYTGLIYPRHRRKIQGDPRFRVNVIVPCKGKTDQLEENLNAIAAQKYDNYVLTFVTDTDDDEAVEIIQKITQKLSTASHLVTGYADYCAQKSYVQMKAIAADTESDVFVICDSDMRPDQTWLTEMVRPFLLPDVAVTTAHRWIIPEKRAFGSFVYTVFGGYYTMFLSSPVMNWVWGGCFAIRRRSYDELGVADIWSCTASDDITLKNVLTATHIKTFFVPPAVTASHELHASVRSLSRWFTRQSYFGKVYEKPSWILSICSETLIAVFFCVAFAFLLVDCVTPGLSYRVLFAPIMIAVVMLSGLLVKLPYLDKEDFSLVLWMLLSAFSHVIAVYSLWRSAFMKKIRWGNVQYEFYRDGKIKTLTRIRT